MGFVHLHVHDKYSLQDGMCKIDELMIKAKELNMNAIATTNHGNLFGVIEFYKAAKRHGIKPIIGCEAYICPAGKKVSVRDNRHIVLLAKNETGYHNLIKIMSDAAVDGFYYDPRTDYETLRRYSEGLICLTACLGGDIPKEIERNGYEAGKEKLLLYIDIFGKENVYLEVQDNGIEEQYVLNEHLYALSKETGVELVATNDVHYIEKEDYFYHDALMALQAKTTIYDDKRKKYPTDAFYLKSYDDMNTGRLPQEALANTVLIAERCNVEFEFGHYHIPKFAPPKEFKDSEEYLRKLAYDGLQARYPDYEKRKSELHERLEYELSVISHMGFIDYFLIVWDFVKYANQTGILDGPGRGSAAGSILAYALNITDVEPLRHKLIFERFLNPSRISMPDIDWDVQDDKRHLVIDYVVKKYGQDNVCQIITFGTYGAKAAVRAAGRALGVAYAHAEQAAKAIPNLLGISIREAMELSPDLAEMYRSSEELHTMINTAIAIEGLPAHTSTHAAGVLISPEQVSNLVPLWKNDGVVVSQFDMGILEELGMLKMDILGLKTLTVIADACEYVRDNHNVIIDHDKLIAAIDDPTSFELIAKGYTQGIFQLEGSGITSVAKDLRPTNIEEVTALISLYRPGPMQYIPQYIANKRDPSQINIRFECLKDLLADTYGIIVYQETVMMAAQIMAGYSMADADSLRKAIGKKVASLIAQHREYFIYGKVDEDNNVITPGAIRNGHDEKELNAFYDEIEEFGRYSFNRSHGSSYAYLAAQTSWLKKHYPQEFMAALMTSVSGSPEKIAFYINHCQRDLGIKVLPPDVNISTSKFVASRSGEIRFGLSAAKGVGVKAVEDIVSEREKHGLFLSFTDFIQRMIGDVDRSVAESLIKCGAFDFTGKKRSQLMAILDDVVEEARKFRTQYVSPKYGQFVLVAPPRNHIDFVPDILEYPEKIFLKIEKDTTGLYISGHPLHAARSLIEKYSTISTSDMVLPDEDSVSDEEQSAIPYLYDEQPVSLICIIMLTKEILTKKKDRMAFVTVEDLDGQCEVIVFPDLYEFRKDILKEDNIVFVEGKISIKDNDVKIIANSIRLLEIEPVRKTFIDLKDNRLQTVVSVLAQNSGSMPTYLIKGGWRILLAKEFWTNDQGVRELSSKGIITNIREE